MRQMFVGTNYNVSICIDGRCVGFAFRNLFLSSVSVGLAILVNDCYDLPIQFSLTGYWVIVHVNNDMFFGL